MEDTAKARAFLSNVIIEFVCVSTSPIILPVLLSYTDFAVCSDPSNFKHVSWRHLESRLATLNNPYHPKYCDVAFEYGKAGEHVLIDCDHALRTMLLVCMKAELSGQVISGKMKWAVKGHFDGEIKSIPQPILHSTHVLSLT